MVVSWMAEKDMYPVAYLEHIRIVSWVVGLDMYLDSYREHIVIVSYVRRCVRQGYVYLVYILAIS